MEEQTNNHDDLLIWYLSIAEAIFYIALYWFCISQLGLLMGIAVATGLIVWSVLIASILTAIVAYILSRIFGNG